jgi:hypothetical protein
MWYTLRCSYDTWSADYKHYQPAHNHDAETAFIRAARETSAAALRGTGQAKFARLTFGDITASGLRVNLPNDPGGAFKLL